MATAKQIISAPAALTVTGLSTLAAATYVTSAQYSNVNQQSDLLAELAITPGTTAGNQQAVLFAQASYDGGTTWQSGPGSGTTATDEPNLTQLGTLSLKTAAGAQDRTFSVAAAFGGILPPMVRFVVKNDSGVAFTAGTLRTMEVSYTVA
jgi:hypothetical protein